MVFSCFRSLLLTLLTSLNLRFPGIPVLSVVIYVVKNASRPKTGGFSPAQDGKHFAVQVGWIVTLREGLFKCFLRKKQLKVCGAINKEVRADMAARFMKTQLPRQRVPDRIRH